MQRKRKKAAHRLVSRKSSLWGGLLDKKHRPVHGFALGGLMVLLHSFWGILALLGSGLMIISAIAYLVARSKSKA